MAEPLGLCHRDQLRLGACVRCVVVIDEAHRAPEHDVLQGSRHLYALEMPLGGALQVTQEHADDVPHRHALALDESSLLDQGAAEHTLQGAQQAPLGAFDIGVDGVAAETDRMVFEIIEYRARQRDRVAFQRTQERTAIGMQRQGRIGRAESQPAKPCSHGRDSVASPDQIATFARPAGRSTGSDLSLGRVDRGAAKAGTIWDPSPMAQGLFPAVPAGATGGPAAYQQTNPPSTMRSRPVQNEAALEARKTAGPTSSSTVAMRAIGVSDSNFLTCSATSGRRFIGVAV